MATNRAIMRVEACADPMPWRTDDRRSPLPMLRPSYILLRGAGAATRAPCPEL